MMQAPSTMNATSRRPLRLMFATLVVAAAAAAVPTAEAAPRGGPEGMGPPPMMMLGGAHLDRMLDVASASAEQRTQIKAIQDAARADLRALHESARPLHEQMAAAFTQPTVDARAVEALRQQMLAQHDKASQRTMQAMLEVSRVLSADQRKAIAEHMAQHRAAMEKRRAERQPAAK